MTHSALVDLPEAVFLLLPRLRDLEIDNETRADCSNCVMLPKNSGAHPDNMWAFHPASRCCTFIPSVPNWMVGRALLREDDSSERIRAQIVPERRAPWGLMATNQEKEDYEDRVQFGRTHTYRCPYFVEGELTCGIWKDRPAICRTWFCKHERGLSGKLGWYDLKGALHGAQSDLAVYCISIGTPPPSTASAPAWESWYRWCAKRVEGLSPMEADTVRGDISRLYNNRLGRHRALPQLPDVVAPSLAGWQDEGETTWFWGYSRYDGVRARRGLFAFLAALDGKTPWRDVLGVTDAVDEHVVRELYRVGCLKTPNAKDEPGAVEAERPSLRVPTAEDGQQQQ